MRDISVSLATYQTTAGEASRLAQAVPHGLQSEGSVGPARSETRVLSTRRQVSVALVFKEVRIERNKNSCPQVRLEDYPMTYKHVHRECQLNTAGYMMSMQSVCTREPGKSQHCTDGSLRAVLSI